MKLDDYINNINKDSLNSFMNLTSSTFTLNKVTDAKVSDTSWIDMVEECIPYLDNIIRNPRRFIVQEENIVPIEKAKVVTEESIRHLAQHTSLIQEVHDDGEVIPLKLLNVYREETIDLYENRFIKSLIDNLYMFVNNKLNESDQKSFSKVQSHVTYQGKMKTKGEEVSITLNLESKKNKETDASKEGHTLDERINHIKEVISAFRASQFIKNLSASNPVRSPIRKTNVILKEPNFIKALELWEYLEKNNIKPITEVVKKNEIITNKDIKDKYDLAFFIANNSLDNDLVETKYNKAIIGKLITEFVYTGDVTDTEFKKLLTKEFNNAKKEKNKKCQEIEKIVDNYIDKINSNYKKGLSLLK